MEEADEDTNKESFSSSFDDNDIATINVMLQQQMRLNKELIDELNSIKQNYENNVRHKKETFEKEIQIIKSTYEEKIKYIMKKNSQLSKEQLSYKRRLSALENDTKMRIDNFHCLNKQLLEENKILKERISKLQYQHSDHLCITNDQQDDDDSTLQKFHDSDVNFENLQQSKMRIIEEQQRGRQGNEASIMHEIPESDIENDFRDDIESSSDDNDGSMISQRDGVPRLLLVDSTSQYANNIGDRNTVEKAATMPPPSKRDDLVSPPLLLEPQAALAIVSIRRSKYKKKEKESKKRSKRKSNSQRLVRFSSKDHDKSKRNKLISALNVKEDETNDDDSSSTIDDKSTGSVSASIVDGDELSNFSSPFSSPGNHQKRKTKRIRMLSEHDLDVTGHSSITNRVTNTTPDADWWNMSNNNIGHSARTLIRSNLAQHIGSQHDRQNLISSRVLYNTIETLSIAKAIKCHSLEGKWAEIKEKLCP